MKSSIVFTASVVVTLLALDAAVAMKTYLKKFPNGDLAFTQALGHVGETDANNEFGKLFSAEGNEYSEKLCKSTFPGTSMTVGAAFGDPCCTWKAGGKADFTVEPFVVPTTATTCASASAPSTAPSTGSSSSAAAPVAPSSGSSSSASTPAPPSSASAAGSTSGASSTPAPAPAPSSASSPSPTMRRRGRKCGVKAASTKSSSDNLGIDGN